MSTSIKNKNRTDAQSWVSALSARLREMRDERGMTQGAVGTLAGLSRVDISRLESGKSWTISNLLAIADAFDIDPIELFSVQKAVDGRIAVTLTETEASFLYTLRADGPIAAMRRLLDSVDP